MADLKISALTASTTPLAGTEVLPIVQSSTTKKVSVADLTAGRVVAASGVAVNATFKSWSVVNAMQVGTGASFGGGVGFADGFATCNSYYDGSNWRRIIAAGASQVALTPSTGLRFNIAGTGTADSIMSWTEVGSFSALSDFTVNSGNVVIGTSGKGITNSTGSVALNFSTAGTSLNSPQSVLSGSFPNVGTAQTITITDTNGGYIVITGVQGGVGSSTWTLPFAKRGGSIAIGTPSKAILTADPILTVAASGGDIVVTPLAGNTYFTFAIYYTPLGA